MRFALAASVLLLGAGLGSERVPSSVTGAEGEWVWADGRTGPLPASAAVGVASLPTGLGAGSSAATVGAASASMERRSGCDGLAWRTLGAAEWRRRFPGLEVAPYPACPPAG
jgi:hypothetical protein